MAKLVLDDPVITINSVNVSDEVKEVRVPVSVNVLESTNAASAGWRQVEGGEKSATVELSGCFESDVSAGLWDVLNDNLGSTVTFSVKLDGGSTSADNVDLTGSILITERPFGGSVNQLHEFSFSFPVDGAVTVATS